MTLLSCYKVRFPLQYTLQTQTDVYFEQTVKGEPGATFTGACLGEPMQKNASVLDQQIAGSIIPVAPIVKWAGGKRQLLGQLQQFFPSNITSYCEPFLGGGAVLFHLQPKIAYVNDLNKELIDMYKCVRDHPDELISELHTHPNDAEHFYAVREWDRNQEAYDGLSEVKRAARMLFLNKTCYNGLYRVNSTGKFNTPFGRYVNPDIVNEEGLRAVSHYLNTATVEFYSEDYSSVLDSIPEGTFVYLDPPYDPVSTTSNFTSYVKGGFGQEEQKRLKECCDKLSERGILFMLSNSSTEFIRNLYKDYNIDIVRAKRNINSDGAGRMHVDEVVIRNY